jgi:hypothetical protein
MEKDSKTTVAVERTTFAKLDRLAKANSVSKMEFITHAINYFEKYGINPVELLLWPLWSLRLVLCTWHP